MVERLVRIQEVRGSIPLISTKKERTSNWVSFLFCCIWFIRGIERALRKPSGGLFLARGADQA